MPENVTLSALCAKITEHVDEDEFVEEFVEIEKDRGRGYLADDRAHEAWDVIATLAGD